MNNPLKYSNVWEDASLLSNALQIDNNSKVMSIAAAGDNSLFLLKDKPSTMLCIDLNPIQLYVTELKEQAIRHLEYNEFLQLLGFKDCDDRWNLFSRIKAHLSLAAKNYFNNQPHLIESGIIHQGKFEQYFKTFAKRVLPFIHNQKKVETLLADKTEEEQATFYNKSWNTWRWKLLFHIFFSKKIMGSLGREPEKLKEVKDNVGQTIFKKAAQHLQSTAAQQNYILQYCLTGSFGNLLPPYAKKQNFKAIKHWLQQNKITYFLGDLEQATQQHKHCNCFNLSNIFEYMNIQTFAANTKTLYYNSAKDSRFAYWNLMVDRKMEDVSDLTFQANPNKDNGFFYKRFLTYKK